MLRPDLGLGKRNGVATSFLRSGPGVARVVSRHRFDVATWFWLACGGLVSQPRFWVAIGAFMWEEQRLVTTSI